MRQSTVNILLIVGAVTLGACRGAADPATAEAAVLSPGAPASQAEAASTWLTETGCSRCHAVSSLGVTSVGQMGPDLSTAVEDVPKRFGTSLEQFLDHPKGTMSIVLSSQIVLTPVQRAQALAHLVTAHREHERRERAHAIPRAR